MKATAAFAARDQGCDPRVFAGGLGDDRFLARVANDTARAGGPDLADIVHVLCALYSRAAGLIDRASLMAACEPECGWFRAALTAWEGERATLATLSVAVGPVPSTPDQGRDDAALEALAQALGTLATSERSGVALGAAAALVVDWHGVRPVLARAADRFGTHLLRSTLPDPAETLAMIAGHTHPALVRAIGFGAGQLVRQHRAVADLLARRSAARAG